MFFTFQEGKIQKKDERDGERERESQRRKKRERMLLEFWECSWLWGDLGRCSECFSQIGTSVQNLQKQLPVKQGDSFKLHFFFLFFAEKIFQFLEVLFKHKTSLFMLFN